MLEEGSVRSSAYFATGSGEVPSYLNPLFCPKYESAPWTTEERGMLLKHVQDQGVPSERINWVEVSSHIDKRSPMDCHMQYENVDKPTIKMDPWSPEEEQTLAELALKYDEHNWCTIAEELQTQRTPFECLRHYQQHLNSKLINNKEFTPEEDELLKGAIEQYGKGHWQAVASCIPGRTKTQCMGRWKKATTCQGNMVVGKWLPEEEKLVFIAALAYGAPRMSDTKRSESELRELFNSAGLIAENVESAGALSSVGAAASSSAAMTSTGTAGSRTYVPFPHWQAMATHVPGKNDVQCREKWINSLDPSVNAEAYTPEEDNRMVAVMYALQHQHQYQSSPHCAADTLIALGVSPHDSTGSSSGSSSTGSGGRGGASGMQVARYGANADLVRRIDGSSIKWAKVAEYMPGRTDASIRSRYNLIVKDVLGKSTKKASAAEPVSPTAAARLSGTKRTMTGARRYILTAPLNGSTGGPEEF